MSDPKVLVGSVLGHYRLIEQIGAGGMGVVYRAHDEALDRDVAIELLPDSTFDDTTARARLMREARTASRLNHSHICTIYEVGETDGQTFIAMELVEGQALSARVAEGPLPVGAGAKIPGGSRTGSGARLAIGQHEYAGFSLLCRDPARSTNVESG